MACDEGSIKRSVERLLQTLTILDSERREEATNFRKKNHIVICTIPRVAPRNFSDLFL